MQHSRAISTSPYIVMLAFFILLELDLQCCTHLREDALLFIGDLSQLRRLNLYSMYIGEELLATIGRYVSVSSDNNCQIVEI